MAKYMCMDTIKYLLYDVHNIKDILEFERYADYDLEAIEMLMNSTKDWTDRDFYPVFREMDENPARYEDGKIIVHKAIGELMKVAGENGYIGSHFSYEDGGGQMPHMVFGALGHMMEAANNNMSGYTGLTTGAADLIVNFATKELKERYVPHMVAGKWGGTMCLTEPQAGSSLSNITTSASPSGDGSFKIKGQKIFISGGDHEYAENFVHLTLARIEGAPKGTKGISLFVVPKKRITDTGLEPNDVTTAGDFQKMGQRGYCTTHLAFGESDDCQGWLVGEENHGLKYMFQMMNQARIDVGYTAASTAAAAYYASLQYANERPQGRNLAGDGSKNSGEEQTLIINHPDVRRMLLLQKSIVEGALSLLVYCTKLGDTAHYGKSAEDKASAHLLLELLTPIAKTYPSEKGQESINNGLQIFGGYGFCMDFPLQQYYRDIRIMSLYEGTTGIQSLDLLGRKIPMKNGQALQLLMTEIQNAIQDASTYDELKPYANKLGQKLKDTQEVLGHLMPLAMKGDYQRYLADATIFMQFMSNITIAWQWLMMATEAKQALVTGKMRADEKFYEAKIHTMKFYFNYELPKTSSAKETLLSAEELTLVAEKELIS